MSDLRRAIMQEAQFVQNITAKEKALGRDITKVDAEARYQRALNAQKNKGGADPNKKLKQSRKAAKKDRKRRQVKTPESATPRESILKTRPRTKRA